MLRVNADDLGRTEGTSESILTCYHERRIHTASGMMFMLDSRRSALLARGAALGVGLHLNLVEEFSGENVPWRLRDHHRRVASYLNARRMNQVVFNPLLRSSFEYDFKAQWEEFCALYGKEPAWLDGHRHMHLCANILLSGQIPSGMRVRRNFTFGASEKNLCNRSFRYLVDTWLLARFKSSDFFCSVSPLNPERLRRLIRLSRRAEVELVVHPGVKDELQFLLSEEWRILLLEAVC